MRTRLRTRSRRAVAAIAALLWLLGVEVLPGLHLAGHEHDHTHAADGTIIAHGAHGHVHRAPYADAPAPAPPVDDDDELARLGIAHEHLAFDHELADLGVLDHDLIPHDHTHDHDDAHEGDELVVARDHLAHTGELAIDHDPPLGHAALGLAHHALALHPPPPPVLAPVASPAGETWTYPAPIERTTSAELARATARGPPVA